MARGQKPDYVVKLPVNGVWHRLGAAWHNDGGTINLILDAGAAITFTPGTKLVLVRRRRTNREVLRAESTGVNESVCPVLFMRGGFMFEDNLFDRAKNIVTMPRVLSHYGISFGPGPQLYLPCSPPAPLECRF